MKVENRLTVNDIKIGNDLLIKKETPIIIVKIDYYSTLFIEEKCAMYDMAPETVRLLRQNSSLLSRYDI